MWPAVPLLRAFLPQPEARTPLAEEVPGGKPGLILRVLLTDAVKRGSLLSSSPGHLCFPSRGDDCVWTRAAGNMSRYKNIHPFEKAEDRISFKPYLSQLVKTWNISGQIRFIWNKEKYSNFGDIKLKVQCSCSWANWCLGKWGLDRFQRFPFLCWQRKGARGYCLCLFLKQITVDRSNFRPTGLDKFLCNSFLCAVFRNLWTVRSTKGRKLTRLHGAVRWYLTREERCSCD